MIGAGSVGCAIPGELARRSASVLVVHARSVGLGVTQASAERLAPVTAGLVADLVLEDRVHPILKVFAPQRFGDC